MLVVSERVELLNPALAPPALSTPEAEHRWRPIHQLRGVGSHRRARRGKGASTLSARMTLIREDFGESASAADVIHVTAHLLPGLQMIGCETQLSRLVMSFLVHAIHHTSAGGLSM